MGQTPDCCCKRAEIRHLLSTSADSVTCTSGGRARTIRFSMDASQLQITPIRNPTPQTLRQTPARCLPTPWPRCPEGGAGKPSYEKYAECPAGWTPQSSSSAGSGRSDLDVCVQRKSDCGANLKQGGGQAGFSCIASMPRPLRSKPYNFQIRNSQTGLVETHWFSLKK